MRTERKQTHRLQQENHDLYLFIYLMSYDPIESKLHKSLFLLHPKPHPQPPHNLSNLITAPYMSPPPIMLSYLITLIHHYHPYIEYIANKWKRIPNRTSQPMQATHQILKEHLVSFVHVDSWRKSRPNYLPPSIINPQFLYLLPIARCGSEIEKGSGQFEARATPWSDPQ